MILKNGEKNIKHLSHKPDSKCIYRENKNNNQETYEHKYAKEYLKDNLTYFREYGHEIVIKDGEFKLGGYIDLDVESIEIEYRGLKQANSSSMLNTIKELNTLTDLYPKKSKEEDINLEDREAEKIANAILELRGKNGTK